MSSRDFFSIVESFAGTVQLSFNATNKEDRIATDCLQQGVPRLWPSPEVGAWLELVHAAISDNHASRKVDRDKTVTSELSNTARSVHCEHLNWTVGCHEQCKIPRSILCRRTTPRADVILRG